MISFLKYFNYLTLGFLAFVEFSTGLNKILNYNFTWDLLFSIWITIFCIIWITKNSKSKDILKNSNFILTFISTAILSWFFPSLTIAFTCAGLATLIYFFIKIDKHYKVKENV